MLSYSACAATTPGSPTVAHLPQPLAYNTIAHRQVGYSAMLCIHETGVTTDATDVQNCMKGSSEQYDDQSI